MSFDKQAQRQRALNQTQALLKSGFATPVNPIPVKKVEGPKDMQGVELAVGQKVARAVILNHSPFINVCTVTKLADGKVYLDNSPRAIRVPERLLILK